jgi:hypothetical protein
MEATDAVSVRRVTEEDLNSPALQEVFPVTMKAIAELDEDGSVSLTILLGTHVAGLASLKADGEIMAVIAQNYRRRGVATAALRLGMARAFDSMSLGRIYARARIGTGGEALARRLGLREYDRAKGEVFFELSKADWGGFQNPVALPSP